MLGQREYYSLVAGFREYTLDSEAKGFDVRAIVEEVLESLAEGDARSVKLLYTYYDCENIIAHVAGRSAHNPLGNLSAEDIEQGQATHYEELLPQSISDALAEYAASEQTLRGSFERRLLEAYYSECAASHAPFLRKWAELDRNIRNISAALTARANSMEIESVVVGGGDVVGQILKSSAADFGLKGELAWVDGVIAAVCEESNLLEKEHKIDLIRWEESSDLLNFDYFNINAVLSYLVKVNIVARWVSLSPKRGQEMFAKIMGELSAKEQINNN